MKRLHDDDDNNDGFLVNRQLRKAIREGNINVVRELLHDPDVDPTADEYKCLRLAAERGYVDILRALFADRRVDPSAFDCTVIHSAVRNGRAEVVRILLADPRVDPSVCNNYAIQWAAGLGHAEVVRVLLTDPRVDPSVDNNCPIRWTAFNNHPEVVRVLLTDPRVDGARAISHTAPDCLRVLAADARYGIIKKRSRFFKYHWRFVGEYDVMLAQCLTMAWVAKQLPTWSDIVQPMAERWRTGFFE